MEEGHLFRRGLNQAPLKCITVGELTRVLREVHTEDYGEHQGGSRLYHQIIHLVTGLLWNPMPPPLGTCDKYARLMATPRSWSREPQSIHPLAISHLSL